MSVLLVEYTEKTTAIVITMKATKNSINATKCGNRIKILICKNQHVFSTVV